MYYAYQYRDDDVIPCDCCGHEAPVGAFENFPRSLPKRFLCEICSTSILSRLEKKDELICIAQMLNVVLDKVLKRSATNP